MRPSPRRALVLAALAAAGALAIPGSPRASAAPTPCTAGIRGKVDLQGHPAMHLCWPIFAPGLRSSSPTNLTWRHLFTQVCYAPFLKASGVRIMGAAAMAAERAVNPTQARRLIDKQIDFVEKFVAAHPDEYAIARTPAEARQILTTTTKMVIVHQIEGGRKILLSPGDAAYWKSRGVMLITLIHLLDDELGGSAVNPGFIGKIINLHGSLHGKKRRGLTPRGKAAIVELARAGIVVDLSHMSHDSTDDALAVCRENRIPPVVTHGGFSPVEVSQRSLSPAQMLELYRLGGFFSLPIDGSEVRSPTVPVPAGLQNNTSDMFRFHAETVLSFLRSHSTELVGRAWGQATDADRTRLSIGWASDWNGWTNHARPTPRHGAYPPGPALEVDRVGLAHPGLLPQYFQRVREAGMDLDPLDRNAEQFLQLWERIDSYGTSGK